MLAQAEVHWPLALLVLEVPLGRAEVCWPLALLASVTKHRRPSRSSGVVGEGVQTP